MTIRYVVCIENARHTQIWEFTRKKEAMKVFNEEEGGKSNRVLFAIVQKSKGKPMGRGYD